MPKLSVSIPEDLWARARAIEPDRPASHVVQHALEFLVASKSPKVRPLVDGFDEVVSGLLEEARALHTRGYQLGLDLAREIDYERLANFVDYDGELSELDALAFDVDAAAGTSTIVRGAEAALRDVYAAVRNALDTTP